eukprot:19945-Heterococcus_DN1.PRE.1
MLIWRSVGCVAALSATALRPTLRLYSSASFQEQLDSHQDVRLASGTVITLDERVSLKAHKLNRIFGEGDGATIIGSGHSIIQLAVIRPAVSNYTTTSRKAHVLNIQSNAHLPTLALPSGKRTRLELHNIHLQHVCEHDDKRQVGAALFLLGGAAASLHSCTLRSTRGFGIWMVQKSSCELTDCVITDCGRTGLVGLGTGSATLQRTA